MDDRFYVESIFPEAGLADPHALVDGDKIYVICGHDKSPMTDDTWVMDKWIVLESENLVDWKKVSEILPTDTYIGNLPNCWAGNLKKKNDKYYWFFSNRNISTGVLVADHPTKKFVDVLGKPLIDRDMSPNTYPYDPVVHIENGEYFIIVGANKYYIAKLADDLLSLETELQLIEVLDDDNNTVRTADKPSFFKRNEIYYLVWGGKYATSDNMYGPFRYKGEYNKGCGEHNDLFVWKDQWYMVSEHPELTHFYRGVSVTKIDFNEDGSIVQPRSHKINEKEWNFDLSTMGYHAFCDLTVEWNKEKYIEGDLLNNNAMLQSTAWCGVLLDGTKTFSVTLKNESSATKAKVILSVEQDKKQDFKSPVTDWEKQASFTFDISSNDTEFHTYEIDIKTACNGQRLKRLAIMPAMDVNNGHYKISQIKVCI